MTNRARPKSWLSLVVLLVALLAARSSHAAPSFDDLIQQGIALRREGKDAEALELFQRAQQTSPSARGLAQVALAEQALGRWLDAEAHLTQVLAMDDPWVSERRGLLRTALEEVQARLGTLEIHAKQLDAEVFMDGNRAGKVPLALRLSTGTHEVVTIADGFEPTTRTVEIRTGSITRLDVELRPIRTSASKSDYDLLPTPPATGSNAPPAARGGHASWQRTAKWLALAGAVAFLAGAVTAHAIREHEAAAYNDDARCLSGTLSRDERCGDHRRAAERAQRFALIGYVATGIALGGSITLFATDSSRASGRGSLPSQPSRAGALIGWSGAF